MQKFIELNLIDDRRRAKATLTPLAEHFCPFFSKSVPTVVKLPEPAQPLHSSFQLVISGPKFSVGLIDTRLFVGHFHGNQGSVR